MTYKTYNNVETKLHEANGGTLNVQFTRIVLALCHHTPLSFA